MKKRFIVLATAFIALILEIIPYGAVCNFANPEGEPFRRTYSYFDPTPFGYANFSPLIVAVLTVALFILSAVSIFTKKKLRTPLLTVSTSAAVLSFSPLLLGITFFSPVGALITASLSITAVIVYLQKQYIQC